MAEALEIPEKFTTTSRHSFTAIESLALLCARFRSPGDLYNLSMIYDRAQSAITECINELVQYVDARWSHLLECDRGHLFHPSQLACYAAAIHQRGAPLSSIFGFIDCTI